MTKPLSKTEVEYFFPQAEWLHESPGPCSRFDPQLFLKRPNFVHAQLDYPARPHRCDPAQLRGSGPRIWIDGGLDDQSFGGPAIFTERDVRFTARAKGGVLASNGNIQRAANSGELGLLEKTWPVRPGPVIRHAPSGATSIPPRSISYAHIHQAHLHDPCVLSKEIRHVCAPGAKVTICSVVGPLLDKKFDEAWWAMFEDLKPLRSAGERLLMHEFRGFPLELEDSVYVLTDSPLKPQLATAEWTFFEFMAFLRTFPCIQRIEHHYRPTGAGDQLRLDELRMKVWRVMDFLQKEWGNPRKTRLIRWLICARTGFLPK